MNIDNADKVTLVTGVTVSVALVKPTLQALKRSFQEDPSVVLTLLHLALKGDTRIADILLGPSYSNQNEEVREIVLASVYEYKNDLEEDVLEVIPPIDFPLAEL